MQVLIYNELDIKNISGFEKLVGYLKNDDFKSAEVKKIQKNLYRAKLNRSDRILFAIYQYQQEKYILILEYLKNHDYQGSRFLHTDAKIDENEIVLADTVPNIDTVEQMIYINPNNPQFVYLNKFISFDDMQQHIYQQYPPLIIIGSAGSGKTAILLEKMKQLEGQVLYVTLSEFLVKNSRELYYSEHYQNEQQIVDFYSYHEFIESIAVPERKFADYDFFIQWYKNECKNSHKNKWTAHSVYEEIKGVITGASTTQAYLSQQDYLELGIKQSIFDVSERKDVYSIFKQYLHALENHQLYDLNMLSFEYLQKVKPSYDFVVIDEVQDITAIQLFLILNSLSKQGLFLICGDANQIVHPNFFSWSKVKSLFYHHAELHQGIEITHILQHNYRNAQRVTEISNRVLLLKNARFGSIDRESHYLVQTNADIQGGVFFLKNKPNILSELNQKTAISTQFAVVVLHEEQKKIAQQVFKTPLVFAIQEAKGLEYQNIILYNFISQSSSHFDEICQNISVQDLQHDFTYARNKDKSDKSLELYKFYINALYVGLTRAMSNIYWVEQKDQHKIFHLLGMDAATEDLNLEDQQSSLRDWQREAQKLELQGKKEQAERIRKEILKEETPNWTVLTGDVLQKLEQKALIDKDKKSQLALFEYAIIYRNQHYLFNLFEKGFKPAIAVLSASEKSHHYDKAIHSIEQKYYLPYMVKNPTVLLKKIEKFGINFLNEFNYTPLMASVWTGNIDLFKKLLEDGADQYTLDNEYRNIFQIALGKVIESERYAKHFFVEFYHSIHLESLILQVDHKLFKIEPHQAEYLIFHVIFIKLVEFIFHSSMTQIDTAALISMFTYIPNSIMPESRKKRSYLSMILSKNECYGQDPYNKKLFLRIKRGNYIFNPNLSIKINDTWYKIYEILDIKSARRDHFYPQGSENIFISDDIEQGNIEFQKMMDELFEKLGMS